jgi:thioredoxin reductase
MKVEFYAGVKTEEITATGMSIVDQKGEEISIPADDIVIATGSIPDKGLAGSLQGKVPFIYEVGDCRQSARIHEAIFQGADAGAKA